MGSGDDARSWHLHRSLLAYHSPVFAAQLDTPAAPAKLPPTAAAAAPPEPTAPDSGTQLVPRPTSSSSSSPRSAPPDPHTTLSLPGTSPDAFALLVKWLYQGRLTRSASLPASEIWPYTFRCQQLHALAAHFRLPRLQNAAMDEFRHGCNAASLVPAAHEIALAYGSEPPGSEMRRLVSAIAARQMLDPDAARRAAEWRLCFDIPDFAMDLVDAMRAGVGGLLLPDPTEDRGCVYHVHGEGELCDRGRSRPRKLDAGAEKGVNGILK